MESLAGIRDTLAVLGLVLYFVGRNKENQMILRVGLSCLICVGLIALYNIGVEFIGGWKEGFVEIENAAPH